MKELLAQAQIGITKQPNLGIQVGGKSSGELVGTIVKNVVTLFFTVAAVGFVIMILWGATEWILSGGDKERVAAARKRITTAIIGIVILSLAFVIIDIVGQVTGIDFGANLRIPSLGITGTQTQTGPQSACSVQGGVWDSKNSSCQFPFGN